MKPTPADTTYSVHWTTPSADANGTMPLGNGEVAVNAWIDPAGDLRFFVARTDSWDEYGRLLKIGAVRVHVEAPGSATELADFSQTLTVRDGTLRASFRRGGERVEFALWVDANHPVIVVEVQTGTATTVVATADLWRLQPDTLASVEVSDIFFNRPEKTVVSADVLIEGAADTIGWFHRNDRSYGPPITAPVQGVQDFPRPDPLLNRTFGAIVRTEGGSRIDGANLRSGPKKRHVFEIVAHTVVGGDWQAEALGLLAATQGVPLARRRREHEAWWASFWGRSWIEVSQNGVAAEAVGASAVLPANAHPVVAGATQHGDFRLQGDFGRVSVFDRALSAAEVVALSREAHDRPLPTRVGLLYTGAPAVGAALPGLAGQAFSGGLTVEVWFRPSGFTAVPSPRLIDKITEGGSDGFLLDIQNGGQIRVITGDRVRTAPHTFTANEWHHVALVVSPGGAALWIDGIAVSGGDFAGVDDLDDAQSVSRAYALQRFVTACAGRGQYPIKYNGSLFTVPVVGRPGYADYRRWGPGYWWQNTRLPYYGMCAAGDYDLMASLFRMYAKELMPLFVYRTHAYTGHDGAYIPECIYFWGDMFTETYGWTPAADRKDKLQESHWHKYEWVSGLELIGLMLDYHDHTGDDAFLRDTALPAAYQLLTFFDQQYSVDADGKLRMEPSQALETWWDCTNPMPEIAGMRSVLPRLMAIPEKWTNFQQRALWERLLRKAPEIPVGERNGKKMLLPAQRFAEKSNIENPELYAVFPFREFAFDRPNPEWANAAFEARLDRGSLGWRQDEIFAAYLGRTADARQGLVARSRHHDPTQRFPAFWGPNYDWTPDQCHGGVLQKILQSMLMQTDGRTIYLLPAWPRDWDCRFKLHAPGGVIVAGAVKSGRLTELAVSPTEAMDRVVNCTARGRR